MNTKALGMIAVIAMLAVCLVPAMSVDGAYYNIDGEKNLLATEEEANYTIIFKEDVEEGVSYSIDYTAKLVDAKGNTQSSAVSPSSGELKNGISQALKVVAPKDAGKYVLSVEFKYTAGEEENTFTSDYPITVVTPINLSVSLKADSEVDFNSFGVVFYVDGILMEDSRTTLQFQANGVGTASYKWIADAAPGEHTYKVVADGNAYVVDGLGEEHHFFVGDNDYSGIIGAMILLVVALIAVFLYFYRKPVKNFGKPKSRR